MRTSKCRHGDLLFDCPPCSAAFWLKLGPPIGVFLLIVIIVIASAVLAP